MVQRKESDNIRCPLEYGLKIPGSRWNARIICVLSAKEVLRYSELRKQIGNITDDVLAASLKSLLDWRVYDTTTIKIYDKRCGKRFYYRSGKRTVYFPAKSFRRNQGSRKGIWNNNFQPLPGRSSTDKGGNGVFRICKAGSSADGTSGIKIY